ncbi:conserved Plasmodium protein, unknown function [Plasmodium relictum]|uniref:CID domain-containing protein n=1 Tax=Plasmodium relictum TaxID=85471 RepID=A0A1J1H172_PLARL|nr:conserved Plasmodium protein, unknown function [Plasmodium relictum]CRG98696.1 conserved Plasmodium protein, unknown function [Plasmodium relictum]
MDDKGRSYNLYKNKHNEDKLNYKTYKQSKEYSEENDKNIKKTNNYSNKNQNNDYSIMKYNSINRNNYNPNDYCKSFNNSPSNKNNMNYNYLSNNDDNNKYKKYKNNDDYYKYHNNYNDENDNIIMKSHSKNISKNNDLNSNANDINYRGSYNYENSNNYSNNKNMNYTSYSNIYNNNNNNNNNNNYDTNYSRHNYDQNNNYNNENYNNKMTYNDDYVEKNFNYNQNINSNENCINYCYNYKSNKQNKNFDDIGEVSIINSDYKNSNINYKNTNFNEKNKDPISCYDKNENYLIRTNFCTYEKDQSEEIMNKKNNTCNNDNHNNFNDDNIINKDSKTHNKNTKEYKNNEELVNCNISHELNEEEKFFLEELLTYCEEPKKDSINKANEWILNKCDYLNNSKVISLHFYNKILKCVNFKNKLNLVFSYHELLRNFMLNNKKKALAEFKIYMNSIIQDAYTCAYYKDQNSINVLLQMVYKWNELSINNFQETKMLLNIFHYDNNHHHNNHLDKSKNEHYSYSNSNKFLNSHGFQNQNYQNQKMPPPPPPPPLPSSNSNDFSKGYNLHEKFRKKDIDENKMNYLNNSMVTNDVNKNPEDISVGFLATLLKYISKKGKKLQNPLIPYTPIDVSYTYQTPPSINSSEKLNEKINDFYDELKQIINDEDIESSDASDSDGFNAYENYKKLKNLDKKKKNYKNSNNHSKLCNNSNNLTNDKYDQNDYSSDTNTTFSSVELFDNSMIELLSDSNNQKKNKKSKNVNFSQIAIENAQSWNDEKDHNTSIFDYYSSVVKESNDNDVFEKYRRSKAYVYHETIAQKFYDLKNKEI